MRWELEVLGVVLRVTLGPEAEEYDYGHERLHADVVHAGDQGDPVFPRLDWGEDEEGRAGHDGLGRGRERSPGPAHGGRPRFGFDPQG